jgi:hypothetical protein
VRERRELEALERQAGQEVARELVGGDWCDTLYCQGESEGLQWGKPGPGGAYWRNSAITGQGFFDKMVSSGQ